VGADDHASQQIPEHHRLAQSLKYDCRDGGHAENYSKILEEGVGVHPGRIYSRRGG
jgi:hypothetical protein